MGARPPQNETSEPDVIEFGIAALAARLEEASIEYPVTEASVVTAVEDTEIPIDSAGNTVALSTALDRLLAEPPSRGHRPRGLADRQSYAAADTPGSVLADGAQPGDALIDVGQGIDAVAVRVKGGQELVRGGLRRRLGRPLGTGPAVQSVDVVEELGE